MKKTAFKTFVCSFVFSLFILFTINGLFFHTPKTTPQIVKIPRKNISLFFMGEASGAVSASVRPVKKIALNLPVAKKATHQAETVYEPADNAIYAQTTPLSSAKPAISEESEVVKEPDFGNIPLEIAADFAEKPTEPEKELVLADFDRIMNTPPPIYDGKKDQKTDVLAQPQSSAAPVLAPDEAKPTNVTASASAPKTAQGLHQPKNIVPEQSLAQNEAQKAKQMQIAGDIGVPALKAVRSITDSNSESGYDKGDDDYELEENDQNLLIPLQKDFAEADKLFKVARAANKDQIAMVSGNVPISSLVDKSKAVDDLTTSETVDKSEAADKGWETMAQKSGIDNPWVAAKGTKFPKNNAVLDAKYYKDAEQMKLETPLNAAESAQDVKLAAEMMQNILIPIPEDILNEKNLVPQLESSKSDKTKKANNTESADLQKNDALEAESDNMPEENAKKENKGGLLKSITSLFSGNGSARESGKETTEIESGNSFVDRITGRISQRKNSGKPTKILPAEMRLAFQPNRAEISGTTLKWIQAFANKVNSDRSVILEIRIDGTSSYALQQKRLNLLHNILTNKGVDYRKINTVFTSREPNSFIIRTVRFNSNIDRDVKESKEQAAYYQSW